MKIGDEELSESIILDRFKLLKFYREFANQIDDHFEYINESEKDRAYVRAAFDKLMQKIAHRNEDS